MKEKEMEQDRNELLAKVGQLTIDVDCLKKSTEMLGSVYEKKCNKR
ncbi:hypothetical protein [Acetobacterium wieringae]